jgi:hypothetical protein
MSSQQGARCAAENLNNELVFAFLEVDHHKEHVQIHFN